jgi:voltage-gated potassium channel
VTAVDVLLERSVSTFVPKMTGEHGEEARGEAVGAPAETREVARLRGRAPGRTRSPNIARTVSRSGVFRRWRCMPPPISSPSVTPDQDRLPQRRLAGALIALAALTGSGALGYMWIEDVSFADALYFTVISLTTVGYGETIPLSEAGRVFTMALLVCGVGLVFYTVVALATFLLEGELRGLLGRRSMEHAIGAMHGHVVICGFGRLGQAIAHKLEEAVKPFVVIETDEARREECEARGYPCVHGSALEERVMAHAGVERAAVVVAATASDADNVFIALSARELNASVAVHARAETPMGVRRLQQAGAGLVVSPHQLGGQRIANAIVRPAVVEFIELTTPGTGDEVDLEEIRLEIGCALENLTLDALPARGVRVAVVAIKGDGPLRLNPGAGDALRGGDRVIVVGDRSNLGRLAELARVSET